MIHELLHAAGLFHEQSRLNRDKHIKIIWANIQDGKAYNFNKASSYSPKDYAWFNFKSIMMYGPKAFSKNGKPTITKLNGNSYTVQRSELKKTDITAINRMY